MTPKRIRYTAADDDATIEVGDSICSARTVYVVVQVRRIKTRDHKVRFDLAVVRIDDDDEARARRERGHWTLKWAPRGKRR